MKTSKVLFSTLLIAAMAAMLKGCSATVYPPKTELKHQVDVPTGASTKLTFLTYNLGAAPDLTPKQQMAYVSTLTNTHEDVTVYGGLYQWGRQDAVHSIRCDKDDAPESFTEVASGSTSPYSSSAYNSSTDTKFVYGEGVGENYGDWVSDHVDDDNRWGNGGGLEYQTSTTHNSTHPYSSNNQNNPCPSGFRVPTQHEWALIGKEDGDPTSASGDYFSTLPAGSTPNSYTTWVPVKNAKVSASWSSGTAESNSNYSDLCGYALYKKDVWDSAGADYKNGTLSLAANEAPEVLMFMPAAGVRHYNDGSVYSTGLGGYYWSSTVNGGNGRYMHFYSSYVYADDTSLRAYGMSVRCVAEF